MKKLFSLRLVVMLLCAAMTGCFTSTNTNPTEPEEPTGDAEKTTSVKITDTFSAEDPEGVTYETRHVYAGDKNCVMIQNMALQGYNASAMYVILYENEGKAVGEYQIFVCDTEDDANKLKAFYSAAGQNLTQDGVVLYMFSDADMVQSTITMYVALGALSEETVNAYLTFVSTSNGLIKQ